MANSLRDDAVSPDDFFGDGLVCAFTVDWRVDTTTNLGFQDDLDPPSESRLVQLWLNLEPRTDIKLPWGKTGVKLDQFCFVIPLFPDVCDVRPRPCQTLRTGNMLSWTWTLCLGMRWCKVSHRSPWPDDIKNVPTLVCHPLSTRVVRIASTVIRTTLVDRGWHWIKRINGLPAEQFIAWSSLASDSCIQIYSVLIIGITSLCRFQRPGGHDGQQDRKAQPVRKRPGMCRKIICSMPRGMLFAAWCVRPSVLFIV